MQNSSARLAGLLSGGIALITSLLLALFEHLTVPEIAVVFAMILAVGFTALYFALEYFFMARIGELTELVGKLRRQAGMPAMEERQGLPGLSRDIMALAETQQREIEKLRKQEAFRKDFVADVSHELKTPIFAAQGFVHTLLDGAVKERAVRKKFLKKAAKSLDDLDMLVQDLLTLSQIETGQVKMHFRETDLYALTEEVFDQFRGKGSRKSVSLRIEGPVRKVPAYADSQRISQVMTNLISNAIKYSGDKPEVVVEFTNRKKSVVVRVRDAGEGMAKEHIHRIFERFYRIDKSRSREKGGTGLGLAIVKHILEGHHSRARVASVPGKGSAFSFKLPKSPPADTEQGGSNL